MNIYIIDLRNEDELSEKYLVTASNKYTILNIPLRYVGFNYNYINNLTRDNLVYLVCRSGTRSFRAKVEFFSNNDNVKSLGGGLNGINIFNGDIAIISDVGSYSPLKYTKVFIILLICITLLINYLQLDNKYFNIGLIIILVFIIYQLVNKSCYLENILPIFRPQV
jgi:rhodanese-related sulfurtransferase